MTLRSLWTSVIEYETPRLVKIHNRKLGLVRRSIQFAIISYVGFYALWLQQGYQEFANVESSVTVKIKGVTKSILDKDSVENKDLYNRVWDEADYVVPPAENGAFFVATNVIITPNQTRGRCPEDFQDIQDVLCTPDPTDCIFDNEDWGQWRHPHSTKLLTIGNENDVEISEETTTTKSYVTESLTTSASFDATTTLADQNFSTTETEVQTVTPSASGILKCRSSDCPQNDVVFKAHGPLTGFCVPSDRPNAPTGAHACEVESWCPIEIDKLPLASTRALMAKAEDYTVFIKNSIAFPYFGSQYVRNNLVANNNRPCPYHHDSSTGENNGCQIFRLGDIVTYAGGNFSQMAIKGGVVSVSIIWNCNLDLDFMSRCLPKYSFRILDDFGWNFREAKYHEEHRRTLYKLYGIKFILTVEGRGGKFNLKNTILNVGSGLALLGISTVICDFLLMYVKEKGVIKQKKYDYINVGRREKQGPTVGPTITNGESFTQGNGCLSRLSDDSHLDTGEGQVTRTTTTDSQFESIRLMSASPQATE